MSGAERNTGSKSPESLSEDEWRARVAEAAYHRAERRGFEPGYELEDWLEAEQEVETALRAGPSARIT